MKDANEKILSDDESKQKRWKERFEHATMQVYLMLTRIMTLRFSQGCPGTDAKLFTGRSKRCYK